MEHKEPKSTENTPVEPTKQQADERLTVEVPTEIQAGGNKKSRGYATL